MAIIYNRNPNPQNIYYNGHSLDKVIYNGLSSDGTFVNNMVIWDKTPKAITKLYETFRVSSTEYYDMEFYITTDGGSTYQSVKGSNIDNWQSSSTYGYDNSYIKVSSVNGFDFRIILNNSSAGKSLKLILKVDGIAIEEINKGAWEGAIDITRNITFATNINAIRLVATSNNSYLNGSTAVREVDIQTISGNFYVLAINKYASTSFGSNSSISFNGVTVWKGTGSGNQYQFFGVTDGDVISFEYSRNSRTYYQIAMNYNSNIIYSTTAMTLSYNFTISPPTSYASSGGIYSFVHEYDILEVVGPSYSSSTRESWTNLYWREKQLS